jgi:hypothetical protein
VVAKLGAAGGVAAQIQDPSTVDEATVLQL